jgi:propionate CoA-transferase
MLSIVSEGSIHKFIRDVEQITFSAAFAVSKGLPVKYITERAVFSLSKDGLVLEEIAPGIDIDKDILGQMDFAPTVGDVKTMDTRIFKSERMMLRP